MKVIANLIGRTNEHLECTLKPYIDLI